MIIRIPLHTIPKKNAQQIIRKGNRSFIIQSDRYLQFEKDCGYFLNKYNINIDYPVNLKCTFYVPDKRKRDLVNLLNAIQDILVKYGVIADDNYNIVSKVDGSQIIYEKNRKETIVEITRIGE